MTLPNMCNLCSHLRNASHARLGITSFPHTKYNLAVLLALQRAGYLSWVTRANKNAPPDPNSPSFGDYEPPPLTTANVASQRLWVGLKYSNDRPVIGQVASISKPKRPVTADMKQLERLARGLDAGQRIIVRGLNLGESMFVGTSGGVLEVREALARCYGGLLLCRCGP